ncbi:MAG: hypothetical protein ABEJ05_11430 [Haloglomus sp.]
MSHTVSIGIPIFGVVVGMAVMILGVLQGGINLTLLLGTLVLMGGIGYLARDIIVLESKTEPEGSH